MQTALITGGTSGIGAAFARALAARGDALVLVARDAPRLAETAASLRARYGVEVETITADLADRAQVQQVADRVADPARPVDILVNNAGFSVGARLLDDDMERHDAAAEVMMRTPLLLSSVAGRAMRGRGHGAIINVGSTAGYIAQGHYSALKDWLRVMTEGLAVELHGTGVTATVLAPGWVRTEFHERAGIKGSSIPSFLWLDADRLVADCLADVERGKVISIPSRRFKVLIGLLSGMPRRLVRRVSRLISSRRSKEQ
jgi:uncharacterized protein